MQHKRLWIAFAIVLVASFSVLGGVGRRMITQAPPVPNAVVTPDGHTLFMGETIVDGQNVWQSIGGQEVGSIWGHGAYIAPDWTADWLHRESEFLLNHWSQRQYGSEFTALGAEQQAVLRARLETEMRSNTFDPQTKTIRVSADRAAAFESLAQYYTDLFRDGRSDYAIQKSALADSAKARRMASFFWWTAWAAGTRRPGATVTYTNNWPHEELVGNRPTSAAIVWSIISFVLLLAGVGGMVWYYGSQHDVAKGAHDLPSGDPMLGWQTTASQRATMKYFLVVAALWVVQILLGAITAHYGVEGSSFYGIPLDRILPYSITRTWHLQIGIFWIATSWLATGLFLAPAVGGGEPKGQRIGVNILFGALILVVVGSLAGEWLGIQQKLGNLWFWFGSQGYEYVDLGRVWQIALFGGLVFWLWLMWRALKPAFRVDSDTRPLLAMFVISAIAIPLFYAAGLMYGQRSHLVTAEYWRWWVVHLWVEGFFEVFATVVIAFLFTRLGLLSGKTATRATLFSTVTFLAGGIIGTFHHLYFTGAGPTVLALGAVFSGLEVVPLVLVGFEAWENLRLIRARDGAAWLGQYRWPVYFFVAVAFWNFVGAGLFGFLINPPVALYYMQGLNTTPVHGHTALFGVYGMLALGLMLFSLRALKPGRVWRDRPISLAFWFINIGLVFMVLLSLLPIGLMQGWASVEYGTWYARSAEFLHLPGMSVLRWMRVPGDSLFAIGALILGWFVLGLVTGHSYAKSAASESEDVDALTHPAIGD